MIGFIIGVMVGEGVVLALVWLRMNALRNKLKVSSDALQAAINANALSGQKATGRPSRPTGFGQGY